MYIFAAFRSVPDYSAPSPPLHSLHMTLEGAIEALYPDRNYTFREIKFDDAEPWWEGPDGFGMVRKMEVYD